jgi:subtilisin family serine protease
LKKYQIYDFEKLFFHKPGPDLEYIYLLKLALPSETDLEEVAFQYSLNPNVKYAEPDYLLLAAFVPNDPYSSQQWTLEKIQAFKGWDLSTGSEDIVVAVIDSGISFSHPDLKKNIWRNPGEIPNNNIDDDNGFVDDIIGWDFVNLKGILELLLDPWRCIPDEDCQDEPFDRSGHGTEIAGIIAAEMDNGKGIAGLCPACKIMPVRAGYTGIRIGRETGILRITAMVRGIKYATDNGADIINMSFSVSWGIKPLLLKGVLNYAYQKGVILVACGGNGNKEGSDFPASSPYVISVAASDKVYFLTSFTNYGKTVDIAAPGAEILTTTVGSGTSLSIVSGTSYAAPHVAGLIGLMLSLNPYLTFEEIRDYLMKGADPLAQPDLYGKTIKGGRINVYKTLKLLK